MQVRCFQIINARTGETQQMSKWLTIGKTYDVISVLFGPLRKTKLRLISDDNNTPSYHDVAQFEIVDPKIPSDWRIVSGRDQTFEMTHEAFTADDFWFRYFDGDSNAKETFLKIVGK
jgi:hypothetical protein